MLWTNVVLLHEAVVLSQDLSMVWLANAHGRSRPVLKDASRMGNTFIPQKNFRRISQHLRGLRLRVSSVTYGEDLGGVSVRQDYYLVRCFRQAGVPVKNPTYFRITLRTATMRLLCVIATKYTPALATVPLESSPFQASVCVPVAK